MLYARTSSAAKKTSFAKKNARHLSILVRVKSMNNQQQGSLLSCQWHLIVLIGLFSAVTILTGCVLPYPVEPDVEQSELAEDQYLATMKYAAVLNPSSDDTAKIWEKRFTNNIGKRMTEAEPRIEILDSAEFWQVAFSESEDNVLLKNLLEPAAYNKSNNLNIDYLVVINAFRTIDDTVLWVPGLGGSSAERGTSGSALIIDWQDRRIIEKVSLSARGKEFVLNIMFYAAGYHATTETSLKSSMSSILASEIGERSPSGPIRVVLFTATNIPGSKTYNNYATILKRAEEGDPESQIQAYFHLVQTNRNEGLYWLCQAADNGYFQALVEVGNLYWREYAGTHKDIVRAYAWYSLAAKEGGDSWEVWELREVRKEITAHQLAEADKLLADWISGQCERDLVSEDPRK